MSGARTLVRLARAGVLAGMASLAAAAPVPRDPALPEPLRRLAPAPETRGEVLRQQVEAKLRRAFEAADAGGTGHVTRAEAEAAGLGYVARHFEQIDTTGHGSVSWAQVRAFLAARSATR